MILWRVVTPDNYEAKLFIAAGEIWLYLCSGKFDGPFCPCGISEGTSKLSLASITANLLLAYYKLAIYLFEVTSKLAFTDCICCINLSFNIDNYCFCA